MDIIYVDSLFLLSLLTDYLLCLLSGRLCGAYLKRWRYLAAALLGAAYSVAVFLPGLGFLASPAAKLLSAAVMGAVAFGAEERPLRCTGVFLAVSTFGGALTALGLSLGAMDLGLLLLCFLGCYLGLSLLSRVRARAAEQRLIEVELGFLGRSCRFRALTDSGNCLTDPLTGARVLVASPSAVAAVFGGYGALLDIRDAVELTAAADLCPELRGRLRLIPYSALGGKGLLPLFRPDSLRLDGRETRDLLVALSPEARGQGFQAIVGI